MLIFVLPPLIIIGALLLSSMIVLTGQQTVRMIETFGKFSGIRTAGLSFKAPWPIQSASTQFSLRQLQLSEDVGVKSVDNAFLNVPIKLQYRVNPEAAQDAYYKLDNPVEQIRSYIVNQVRATAGGLTFEELFKSRDTFEGDVEETLSDKMAEFGYIIVNVLVDDPQPSEDLRDAFDRVIASQRLKEAATNEGEAARIMSVANAEAEGEALEIKGRAYAKFRKTVADGNAEALNSFVGETGLTAKDGLTFFNSINEMEALRDAAQHGGKVVFISAAAKAEDGAALMGMVAGVEGDEPRKALPKPSKAKGDAKNSDDAAA